MNDVAQNHLMDLYGLNPNIMPLSLQFPRIPVGIIHPAASQGNFALDPKRSLVPQSNNTLEDFKQTYQKFASGLLTMTNPGLVPPGHPLYNRQHSVDILKAENLKLQKENLDLKRQLDESHSTHQKHDPKLS